VSNAAMPSQEKPIEFNADHPFIFIIRDKNNGEILFIGRMSNPAQ